MEPHLPFVLYKVVSCAKRWEQQMLKEVERTLNTLAAPELEDKQVRAELGQV